MCRPSSHHWETDALERLGQIKHQRDRSQVHVACPAVRSCPFRAASSKQHAPHLTAAIPNKPDTCPAMPSPFISSEWAEEQWRSRLWPFFGIKKNVVWQACCGHFPHWSTFSMNVTTSLRVTLDRCQGILGVKPVTTNTNGGFVTPRRFLRIIFFQLRQPLLQSSLAPQFLRALHL